MSYDTNLCSSLTAPGWSGRIESGWRGERGGRWVCTDEPAPNLSLQPESLGRLKLLRGVRPLGLAAQIMSYHVQGHDPDRARRAQYAERRIIERSYDPQERARREYARNQYGSYTWGREYEEGDAGPPRRRSMMAGEPYVVGDSPNDPSYVPGGYRNHRSGLLLPDTARAPDPFQQASPPPPLPPQQQQIPGMAVPTNQEPVPYDPNNDPRRQYRPTYTQYLQQDPYGYTPPVDGRYAVDAPPGGYGPPPGMPQITDLTFTDPYYGRLLPPTKLPASYTDYDPFSVPEQAWLTSGMWPPQNPPPGLAFDPQTMSAYRTDRPILTDAPPMSPPAPPVPMSPPFGSQGQARPYPEQSPPPATTLPPMPHNPNGVHPTNPGASSACENLGICMIEDTIHTVRCEVDQSPHPGSPHMAKITPRFRGTTMFLGWWNEGES